MNLNTLFEQLAYGELSQHRVGKEGTIALADYPMLISHINHGLTLLHARLPLQHKELTLVQFKHITDYRLDPKYSVSAADPDVIDKYILDTVEEPFSDDLIRIQSVFDGAGCNIPLNDEYAPNSWFTPNPDTIQIPYPVDGNVAAIIYRANHIRIPTDTVDAKSVNIELPTVLENALAAHVASRVFVSLGSVTSGQLSSYYGKLYQAEVAQVERLNLLQSSESNSDIKFEKGGWK